MAATVAVFLSLLAFAQGALQRFSLRAPAPAPATFLGSTPGYAVSHFGSPSPAAVQVQAPAVQAPMQPCAGMVPQSPHVQAPVVDSTNKAIETITADLGAIQQEAVQKTLAKISRVFIAEHTKVTAGLQEQTDKESLKAIKEAANKTVGRYKEIETVQNATDVEAKIAFGQVAKGLTDSVGEASFQAIEDVLRQAQSDMLNVGSQTAEIEHQAKDLAAQVKMAENATVQAGKNVNTYVDTMPISTAKQASDVAGTIRNSSRHLGENAAAIKIVAKLASNIAMEGMQMSQEAFERTKAAQSTALQAVLQATENAKLLQVIQAEIDEASGAAAEANINAAQA